MGEVYLAEDTKLDRQIAIKVLPESLHSDPERLNREGYLEAFVRFWSAQAATKQIWMSLYTPQVGEVSAERLTAADRRRVVQDLHLLRTRHPKLAMRKGVLEAYAKPPQSPAECVFAKTTHCVSADFQTQITPCQFGGTPDCANCGCIASAALKAVARHKLPGGIPVGVIVDASFKVGAVVRAIRKLSDSPQTPAGTLDAPNPASPKP